LRTAIKSNNLVSVGESRIKVLKESKMAEYDFGLILGYNADRYRKKVPFVAVRYFE
jgi:hypothetical protein